MDLPPVGGAAAPRPAAGPPPQMVVVQQRPSLSYLIFLSILFFMISNNGPNNQVFPEGDDTLALMRRRLETRQAKREGLAQWLGVGNQSQWDLDHRNETSNATTLEVIPFVPKHQANPALVPALHQLMDRPTRATYYHQNLTGFVRGDWKMGNWSLAQLGLPETYNTTELRPEKPKEEAVEGEAAKEEEATTSTLVRRQLFNETIETRPSPKLVNTTIEHNRTTLQNRFAWSTGGKVSFSLKEEQSSVVGPVVLPKEGKEMEWGQVLQMREGPKEWWEEEGPAVYLHGDVTFTDIDTVEEVTLDIEGIHFLSQGTFFAYATPPSARSHMFDSVGLPLFDSAARANRTTTAAGFTCLKEIDKRIVDDKRELTDGVSGGREEVIGGPSCIFTLYGSISSLPSFYTPPLYGEYYSSLFHPTGTSLPSLPPALVTYTLYSENCGIVLEGTAESLPSAVLWTRATDFALLMTLAQGVLVWLLVRQMGGSGVGSASKVAYATVGAQTAMDAYFFIIMFTVGIVTNNRASLPTLVPAFLSLVSSLVFGMRYAAIVRSAAPPPVPRPAPPPPPTRESLSAAAAERRMTGASEGAATPRGSVPSVVVTPPEDDSDFLFICAGIVAAIFAGSIIWTWGWLPLILMVVYSYWIPQIIHNVQRGAARLSLRREYIIGTTIARLILPYYFWGVQTNVLAVETSRWVYALVGYSCFQAAVLLTQDSRLGARFFLPYTALARLRLTETETWDYHPPLPPSDLEASSPDGGHPAQDCPICLAPIEFASSSSSSSSTTTATSLNKEQAESAAATAAMEKKAQDDARWGYMVPPCHHIAHTECLESWLAIKSVCPVCRGRLPPL